MKLVPAHKRLERLSRRGFRGYPVASVAYYGPNAKHATKVAVGILEPGDEVVAMERWYTVDRDARTDGAIGHAILAYLEAQRVKSVVIPSAIIGCPHEEGIDYPDGAECPQCPYWHGKDRWKGVKGL